MNARKTESRLDPLSASGCRREPMLNDVSVKVMAGLAWAVKSFLPPSCGGITVGRKKSFCELIVYIMVDYSKDAQPWDLNLMAHGICAEAMKRV